MKNSKQFPLKRQDHLLKSPPNNQVALEQWLLLSRNGAKILKLNEKRKSRKLLRRLNERKSKKE